MKFGGKVSCARKGATATEGMIKLEALKGRSCRKGVQPLPLARQKVRNKQCPDLRGPFCLFSRILPSFRSGGTIPVFFSHSFLRNVILSNPRDVGREREVYFIPFDKLRDQTNNDGYFRPHPRSSRYTNVSSPPNSRGSTK